MDLSLVLTVITLVTAAVAGLLVGGLKGLRDSNNDLRARSSDQDKTIATQAEQIKRLTSDYEALTRVVTGEAHLTALTERLDEHHSEAMGHWERTESLMTALIRALERTKS